jgi:hypothetical protein
VQTTASTPSRLQPRSLADDAADLVVADAGVDHQPKARRLDQQGVDGEPHPILVIDEVRIEPGHAPQRLGSRLDQERVFGAVGDRHLHLDHPGDRDRAHRPAQHRLSPWIGIHRLL